MALEKKGNDAVSPIIQPGWTVSGDGFGLVTSTTRYKADWSFDLNELTERGTPHPDPTYSFLTAHKYNVSWDSLDIATVTVDYVGIDPDINGGDFTNANTSAANGLTSENITAHPNFFTVKDGHLGPIAGEAPYTQDSPDHLAPTVNGKPAFLGLNGSCFEKESGGRFIGFVDPSYPQYYGKTQYLAQTTSYSGVIYLADATYVMSLVDSLMTSSLTQSWGGFELLPDWAPIGAGLYGNPRNLLSQVNVEEFGLLYKVMYEIRYSGPGWELDVYKQATAPA